MGGQLDEVCSFLDDCLKRIIHNLLPGGNYQRKTLSLDLLLVIINNFLDFKPGVGSNKKSGNGDPAKFMKYCRERGEFNLDTKENLEILILNLEDHNIDVKEKTFLVLKHFSVTTDVYHELF